MTIFTDTQKAADEFKARVCDVPGLGKVATAKPEAILLKLKAAEAEVKRRLRILLEPTWVFSEDSTDIEIAARSPADSPYLVDPGYDYHPDIYIDNAWGWLSLRQKPLISVSKYYFFYAVGAPNFFQVPAEWLRLDKKFANVRILPSGPAGALLPLNAFLLSALTGGRTVPHFVRVVYKAGIVDVRTELPDLYDFILRVATLLYIRDGFPGSSESISADGLSQSRSFDLSAYTKAQGGVIEAEYDKWQQFFHGVRCVTV